MAKWILPPRDAPFGDRRTLIVVAVDGRPAGA